nr:MAG TPA: PolyVal Metallopeptidase superfamily domain [Caudoviricetes sp.]
MTIISNYINNICDILNITTPIISFDVSNFQTHTMMAQCNVSGDTIYLRKVNLNPDYLFAIAHELRHIWQIRTNKSKFFDHYKPREDCNSAEEYNLQLAEVDANAFAAIIMTNYFHLQPQWNGLTNKVIKAINARIDYILS